MSAEQALLVAAGAITWLVVGAPLLAHGAGGVAWGAYVGFAVAFAATAGGKMESVRDRALGLAAQSVAALVLARATRGGTPTVLLVVVAGQAPFVLGARGAFAWVAGQTAILGAVLAPDRGGAGLAFELATYSGFELFGVAAATFAVRESEARRELARANAELVATRALFADGMRAAERLRIARELHDVLGHHLTALVLNLELARKTVAEGEREPVERAHAIAKALLAELREVVGAMREERPVDVAGALGALAAAIPDPRVHLSFEGDVRDAAAAHAVFRCVQEVLTNAVRHARAKNVWIDVRADAETVHVSARDDGRGMAPTRAGHGLAGMRERVAELGGDVAIESALGRGTTIDVRVPVARPESA